MFQKVNLCVDYNNALKYLIALLAYILMFQKMTMAVVEYNNKAYFGEMTEGDKFTFAKMPFGKLDNPINWDQVKEGSFLINPRDKVKLDPKYIICNVKCRKTKNKIVLNDDQMNFIKTKLSKHINQQKIYFFIFFLQPLLSLRDFVCKTFL